MPIATKIRPTVLCLSGFELYSRWVPLITVLPCVDKVFEQPVGAQNTAGFDGRMYENSSAYRKSHSCETTLINLVEEWRLARDNKLAVTILSTESIWFSGKRSTTFTY